MDTNVGYVAFVLLQSLFQVLLRPFTVALFAAGIFFTVKAVRLRSNEKKPQPPDAAGQNEMRYAQGRWDSSSALCTAIVLISLGAFFFWQKWLPDIRHDRDTNNAKTIISDGNVAAFARLHAEGKLRHYTQEINDIRGYPLTPERAAMLHMLLGKEDELRLNYEKTARWLAEQPPSPERTGLLGVIVSRTFEKGITLETYRRFEKQNDPAALAALKPMLATTLAQAVHSGRPDLLKKGLALGGDPYRNDRYSGLYITNALDEACKRGDLDALSLILQCPAPTEALGAALFRGKGTAAASILLQAGADPGARQVMHHSMKSGHYTALQGALLTRNFDRAALLLDAGAPPHAPDSNGRTALFYAVAAEAPAALIQRLITPGAAGAKDMDGFTPLHWAAYVGNIGAAKTLIAAGADMQAASARGYTPLHMALLGGKGPGLAVLQKHATPGQLGAMLAVADARQVTPLSLAASPPKINQIPCATEAGVQYIFYGQDRVAAMTQHKADLADFLLQKGASLDAPLPDSGTPAHLLYANDEGGMQNRAWFSMPLSEYDQWVYTLVEQKDLSGLYPIRDNKKEIYLEGIQALLAAGEKTDPPLALPFSEAFTFTQACNHNAACMAFFEQYYAQKGLAVPASKTRKP